jgi:hypothetical protein
MDTLYFMHIPVKLSCGSIGRRNALIIAVVVVVVVIDDNDDALPHPPPFSSSPFARGGGRDSAIGRRKSLSRKEVRAPPPGEKRASAIQRAVRSSFFS